MQESNLDYSDVLVHCVKMSVQEFQKKQKMLATGDLQETNSGIDYVNIYKDKLPRLSLFKTITKHTDLVETCDDKYQTIGRALHWTNDSDPLSSGAGCNQPVAY